MLKFPVLGAFLLSEPAGASSSSFDVSSVMSSAVTSVQGDLLSTLGIVVPAIVVVVGAVVAVKFGIKWLRSLGRG